ncbi:MAG: methyltransferase domain-containing protein [Verrucomicrobia bacterium]|nr:methyltransferase domain-containing protein [Verrucomicrobiota bacterium]
MPEDVNFVERYARAETPWDSGRPSEELLRVLNAGKLTGKTVLEIGCGTGTNALELARRGYTVTAVDYVEQPILAAREKARQAGVTVDFRVADVLKDDLGGLYDILFDRGVYHHLRTEDLKGFQEFLKRATRQGSWWLSLAGNAKEKIENGPPVVQENEIRAELGPLFEILELREFRFSTGQSNFRPLAWSILMRRK